MEVGDVIEHRLKRVINDTRQQRKVGASLLAPGKFSFDELELPALTRNRPAGFEHGFRHDEDPDVDRSLLIFRVTLDRIDEQLGRCSHRLVMVLDRYRGPDVRRINLVCDHGARIGADPEGLFETGKVRQMQPELFVALAARRNRNRIADRLEPATQESPGHVLYRSRRS